MDTGTSGTTSATIKAAIAAVAGAACLFLPASAPAAVLFDHTPSVGGFHPTVQDFETSLDTSDAEVADDFRVPAGEVWIIQRAFVDGRRAGDSGLDVPTLVHAFLFKPAGTLPVASPFYTTDAIPAAGTTYPDLDLALPGVPVLPAGSWWFGAQPRLDLNGGENNYWLWGTTPTAVGSGAAYRNPGDGFGSGCTAFTRMAPDCVEAGGNPVVNPDVAFRLEGVRLLGKIAIVKSKALAGGRLRVTVNAPNEGTLTIKSNLMKPATREVAAPGTLQVVLKPKRKAKRKLARGLRPRAKLTLDGLDPFEINGAEVPGGSFRKRLKP